MEIKCPLKLVDQPIEQYLQDKTSHLDCQNDLKKNHKYFTQVQLQMYVCKVNYCHFITWSPGDCVFSYVERDPLFIQMMVAKAKLFWSTNVFPVLIEDNESVLEEPDESPVYCKCQGEIPNEKMVGCDNETCKFKWFHYSCVGLKTEPRKKTWYCSTKCRNANKRK